ncbi:MAG TPA: hypothetical protein VG034_17995 [Acidimicrobiia bacterium]|jgi:hypothetical protein|nr:hypothetical protein [Acidimicrobiia bacterium]
MATELPLDPEFAAVVERARRLAVEMGEIPARAGRFVPTIPPEARQVIAEWLRGGGYEAAIAQVAAEDPDLANQ